MKKYCTLHSADSASVDIAVFCLALMGTDYPSFLREAARVLKPQGTIWIAEVGPLCYQALTLHCTCDGSTLSMPWLLPSSQHERSKRRGFPAHNAGTLLVSAATADVIVP